MKQIPLLVLGLATLFGCAGRPAAPQPAPSGEPTARSFVYDCGEARFQVEVGGGIARVEGPDGRLLTLQPVRSASGAKYRAGDAVYWSKAESARFQWAGREYAGCRQNPRASVWADAASRGVDFRALGNEPGWLLEIRDGGHLTLLVDYGARRVMVADPGAEQRGGATVYEATTPEHRLRVVIRRQPCRDTMGGEPFEAQVEVVLDGRRYRGCGRWLAREPVAG